MNTDWRIAGAYLESCNCDAICPCRMVDGVVGGRSTHGICFGVLGWRIDDGHAGDVDLSGLGVALALRYDDDEPGSPWTVVLYVDERSDERQLDVLSDIFLGGIGREYYADELRLEDEPFEWTLEGVCAFATTFDYRSE